MKAASFSSSSNPLYASYLPAAIRGAPEGQTPPPPPPTPLPGPPPEAVMA